mgnify:CR=1 FL=1
MACLKFNNLFSRASSLASSASRCPFAFHPSPFALRNPRGGFTLIELLIVTVVMILLSSFVAFCISRWISRPVEQMRTTIERIRGGETSLRIQPMGWAKELTILGGEFNEMLDRIQQMVTEEYEYRLLAERTEYKLLQAQINPHFIYNVLDSIYWMSRMKNQSSNVAEMAISLSRILRYSVNKNDDHHTTVARELQLCQHYLQIQNIRYQGKFRVTIDVDDEIMDCTIIKFLLEPFVENAIVHGLEAKPGDGALKIVGKDLGDEMEFRIQDDGAGVPDPSVFYAGYGITNVIERIKRCYVSENAGCTFTSSPDSGTTVIIRVPKEISLSLPIMQRGPL